MASDRVKVWYFDNNAITPETRDAPVVQMNGPALFKVFVVEDSPAIRTVLTQRILDDSRFSVVGYADTAIDAIGAVARDAPDILIVDLQLKQGTGYDILMHLRNAGSPAGMQAIVLTNFASPAHRRRALELGAHSFFDKSMQFDEMLDSLRAWADAKTPG